MDVKALTGFACALAVSALVQAQVPPAQPQALAGVRGAAEKAVRAALDSNVRGVVITAASIDARMTLPACGQRLDTFVPELRANQARLVVRVSCATPAWTLNVPVGLSRTHEILVMKRAVGRNQPIGAADVEVQKRELPGIASPFVGSVAELQDRLTRRPIPAGSPLPADALTMALLIHRGQSVTLAATTNGIEVRAPGLALADAAPHARVRVQNLNSLKIVEGVADTEGVVRVTF